MRASGSPSLRRVPLVFFGAAVAVAAAALPPSVTAQVESVVPVTDAELQDPSPDDWLMWRRTLDGWGYSPLEQIDRENVGTLRMVWSRALTTAGSRDAARPRRRDVHAEPERRHPGHRRGHGRPALGAPAGGARGHLRLHLRPVGEQPQPGHPRTFVIDTSVDDHVFALDAVTGRLAWETEVVDLPGRSGDADLGSDRGRRQGDLGPELHADGGPEACVITAHDAETGEELWRTRLIPAPGEPGRRVAVAACRTRSGGTSAPGWCRASIPS